MDGYFIYWFETRRKFEKVNAINKYLMINYKCYGPRPRNFKFVTLVLKKPQNRTTKTHGTVLIPRGLKVQKHYFHNNYKIRNLEA